MGLSLTYKILKQHRIERNLVQGETIGIKMDQTLTQDATGTMTFLQFEAIGLDRVKTELSVSYVDHNTLQFGFENADDHRYLADTAAKYGVLYSRAGNGICHQVHLERFAKPGKTLIGADSHTPTAGGVGSFATGAGGIDVAAAMAGAPYYIQVPKVINIRITGRLSPWVSAKDIILKVVSILTTKGNVGTVIEYSGDALQHLTVPERSTITNMGAEMGVTTSIFPSDNETRKFLKAQGREADFIELAPDKDATYFKTIVIDLGSLKPMIALPHSPDNIKTVAEVAGLVVNQVCIGSCTNSSVKDITTVAKILEGKTIHPDVSLVVVPGSKQVEEMAEKSGALALIVSAGARLVEPSCSFCIGMGHSPVSGGVSIRTNNRNYEGRSGTKDAGIYLVSPETAAVTALAGKLTDPTTCGIAPKVDMPEEFLINDNMIVRPPENRSAVKIRRGPNIGDPPKIEPFPEDLRATVSIVVGDKITTDHILPAGTLLKYRSNIKKYSEYVFGQLDDKFAARCLANRQKGTWNIIAGGISYGQGSSREHAALCPAYLGVRAVIAGSIERIHFANLVNFGILPLTFERSEDVKTLFVGDVISVQQIKKKLMNNEPITAKNETKGTEFRVKYELNPRQKDIILAGGLLNYLRRF